MGERLGRGEVRTLILEFGTTLTIVCRCGGPKLASFSGLSTSLTPRARWKSFIGYTPPFDRHDWVVDRCGTQVEYVIDFYAGKNEGKPGKELNFYLDVRPKLNSWEGIRMRVARYWGF
jgi:cytochrome c heme-lyase